MPDLSELFGQIQAQAQQMGERMEKMQADLAAREIEGTSGAGMVKLVINGKGEARRIKIDSSLINADEREILEDLIVAAFNDAKAQLDRTQQEEAAKQMGAFNLPGGFKLPF